VTAPQDEHTTEKDAPVRVGFRYQDGEVLSPEHEALSRDEELSVVVLDLGDGEWLTLEELRGDERTCPECGHQWSPDGCTGDPTPSDLWAGISPSACDCLCPIPSGKGGDS
jgi:hypothetical protein